jgi:hypothetical protein
MTHLIEKISLMFIFVVKAAASNLSVIGPSSARMPDTLAPYATPTAHTELGTAAISPAHLVP